MGFSEVLEKLVKAPGMLGAAFLDPQGQPIAQVGDEKAVEVIAAYQSVWLGEVSRAAGRAGLGGVSDLALDFDRRKVLSAEVKDGYFLLVVADRTGLLSVARARLDEARTALAREFL